jgi:hypothetical protein
VLKKAHLPSRSETGRRAVTSRLLIFGPGLGVADRVWCWLTSAVQAAVYSISEDLSRALRSTEGLLTGVRTWLLSTASRTRARLQ